MTPEQEMTDHWGLEGGFPAGKTFGVGPHSEQESPAEEGEDSAKGTRSTSRTREAV